MLRLFIFSRSSIVLVSVTNSFSDTPKQICCNNMKMEHIYKILCGNCVSSLQRFCEIQYNCNCLKKSRENIIPLNNQEDVERVTKLHNINRLKEIQSVQFRL